MISRELLEQAANDSALVQRIELMVWSYMDQAPVKRDAIALAMAIIEEVRSSPETPVKHDKKKPVPAMRFRDDENSYTQSGSKTVNSSDSDAQGAREVLVADRVKIRQMHKDGYAFARIRAELGLDGVPLSRIMSIAKARL